MEHEISKKTKQWLENNGYFVSKSVVATGEASGHAQIYFNGERYLQIDHLGKNFQTGEVVLVEDVDDTTLSDLNGHLARLVLAGTIYGCKMILATTEENVKTLEKLREHFQTMYNPLILERISILDINNLKEVKLYG